MEPTKMQPANGYIDNHDEDDDRPQVETVQDIVGDWGRWQKNVFYFYLTISIFQAFNNLGLSLMAPASDFWCEDIQPDLQNRSDLRCFRDLNQTERCTRFEFDHSFYTKTVQEEFSLVCDRSWLVSSTHSMYMIGMTISSVLLGHLSDQYGRLPVLKASIASEILFGLMSSFAPNIVVFMVARLFLAIGAYGRYLTGFMLVMETNGVRNRALKGIMCRLGWAIGYFILPGMVLVFRNFRHLSLACTVPELLWIYWLMKMPESPRWLLAKDRPAQAFLAIKSAAIQNGRPVAGIEDKFEELRVNFQRSEEESRSQDKANFWDLFRYEGLRRNTLILSFTWFATGFIYYGLSLNIGDLGGNLVLNFAIAGVLEFPAFALSIYGLRHWGRRRVQAWIMFGAAGASVAAIPFYVFGIAEWAAIGLGMLIKFALSCSWNVIYLYSAEVYPTVVRQLGVGTNSAASRIGAIIAPFMKEVTQYTHISVSLAIFGVIALLNGLTVLMLPETKDKEIPDTIEEAERRYKS